MSFQRNEDHRVQRDKPQSKCYRPDITKLAAALSCANWTGKASWRPSFLICSLLIQPIFQESIILHQGGSQIFLWHPRIYPHHLFKSCMGPQLIQSNFFSGTHFLQKLPLSQISTVLGEISRHLNVAMPGAQTIFIYNITGKASEEYKQFGGFGWTLHLLERPAMLLLILMECHVDTSTMREWAPGPTRWSVRAGASTQWQHVQLENSFDGEKLSPFKFLQSSMHVTCNSWSFPNK